MSAPNASLSSSALVSFAADPNYTKTEGFKQFQRLYNKRNAHCAHNDPNTSYPNAAIIYNRVKNSGSTEKEFKDLSLQDFMITSSVTACHKLKWLSLAPYYQAHIDHCTWKWDAHDNQGKGTEVVNFCHQLMGVVSIGLYNLMADVQETIGWLMLFLFTA